jgi:hypothetical protein
VKHTPQISRHANYEFVCRAPCFDPIIDIAYAPVVGSNRIWPVLVAPIQLRQIGAPDYAVFRWIKPITATHIGRCRLTNLHRPLRPGGIGAPHHEILTMAGLCTVNRIGHPIERCDDTRPDAFDRSLI